MAEIRGLKELLDNFELLGVSVKSAARGATNAAAQVVKRKAIENARAQGLVETGALVNNIAVKRQLGTPENITEYHIGVRHGRQAKGAERVAVRGADGKIQYEYTDDPFYFHFWELGYMNNGHHVPARPFLAPALASTAPQLLGVMKDYLAARIDKIVFRKTGL